MSPRGGYGVTTESCNRHDTTGMYKLLPRGHALFQLRQQEVVVKLINALHVAEDLWNHVLREIVKCSVLPDYLPVEYLASSQFDVNIHREP